MADSQDIGAGIGLVSGIAGIGAGIGQTISGAVNLRKDKAALASLTPAYYKIQDEYNQNRNQAASLAQGGLPQASKDYYTEEAGRGLGAGIGAITQGGGSPNDVSKLLDTYQRGIKGVAAEDAEQQLRNIQYFQEKNKELAGQKTMQWTINEYQPYQRKLKELTERVNADRQNIWGGIGTAIGAGSSLGTAVSNQSLLNSQKGVNSAQSDMYNRMFNNGNQQPQSPFPTQAGMPQPSSGKFADPMKQQAYTNFSKYINNNWDNGTVPDIATME